ncbi:MAG: PilZ domain-containing protein [Lachnospiraceae bacterium]|nr:PilZ domain-containing protein [Lachnospiraceae bacterium]
MVTDIIKVGTKIEIMPEPTDSVSDSGSTTSYVSMIQDIFPNGDLEIDMPIFQRKLILLHNGMRYKLVFISGKNTYIAIGEVVDRYKSENRYLLRVELKTQPEKFQRREFFRCEILLDLEYMNLPRPENLEQLDEILKLQEQDGFEQEVYPALILDISGGGIRFVSKRENNVGDYKKFLFNLPVEGTMKHFAIPGRILACKLIQDSKVKYECRVEFVNIDSKQQEQIIRYIFEEERKIRKLSRG